MCLYVHRFKDGGAVISEMLFLAGLGWKQQLYEFLLLFFCLSTVWPLTSTSNYCWRISFLGTVRCQPEIVSCPSNQTCSVPLLNSILTYIHWDSFAFPFRASLGLGEQRRADMWWVLQCSPQPRQAQLASPPPDAHTVACHATAGTKG